MRVCKISFLGSSSLPRPGGSTRKSERAWPEDVRRGQEPRQLQSSSEVRHFGKHAWFNQLTSIAFQTFM